MKRSLGPLGVGAAALAMFALAGCARTTGLTRAQAQVGSWPAATQLTGSIEKERIREVARAHRDEIQRCFERSLAANPGLAGKVAVKFLILPNGTVGRAEVVESTGVDAYLGECVTQALRTWTFPRPNGEGMVLVTYPFLFRNSGREALP